MIGERDWQEFNHENESVKEMWHSESSAGPQKGCLLSPWHHVSLILWASFFKMYFGNEKDSHNFNRYRRRQRPQTNLAYEGHHNQRSMRLKLCMHTAMAISVPWQSSFCHLKTICTSLRNSSSACMQRKTQEAHARKVRNDSVHKSWCNCLSPILDSDLFVVVRDQECIYCCTSCGSTVQTSSQETNECKYYTKKLQIWPRCYQQSP